MSVSTESYLNQVQSIRIQDCIKITVDMEFLNANFQLIKQCLLRVSDLQNQISENRTQEEKIHRQIFERLNYIQKEASDQKVVISDHEQLIKDLRNSIGEDFMKKIDQLEAKTKNSHDLEELVRKLEALNKFVPNETFKKYKEKAEQQIKDVSKIKETLENYVDHRSFKQFKDSTTNEFDSSNNTMDGLRMTNKALEIQIDSVDKKADKATDEVKQNNDLMKEINFVEMQEKMRKHKDQTDNKIGEMVTKLKKKVGSSDLTELEKGLIEKIDKFLFGINQDNASKNQTKDALLFLEKRVNEIIEIITPKEEDQQDALFARKKWNCASCSKDLGKYEGKLGQFRPWAVFPAREMNPEQTGGYGYLNYIDKLAYKRGTSVDDTGLERLNKTFFDSNPRENSPPKKSSTKAINFMSAYGSNTDRPTTSLKEEYFKTEKDRGVSSKIFRVKKDKLKDQTSMIEVGEKERVKEIM